MGGLGFIIAAPPCASVREGGEESCIIVEENLCQNRVKSVSV